MSAMAKIVSKEKDKSIHDILKTFFKSQKLCPATDPWTKKDPLILSQETMKDLSVESPIANRLRVMKEIGELVLTKYLEENGVEALWVSVSDLMDPSTGRDTRQICLAFIRCLVLGQYDRLSIMRTVIFEFLLKHDVPEDLELRFDILKALTDNGKDIKYFEGMMGSFILQLMDGILSLHCSNDFLILLTNLIKFNSTLLEDEVVILFVRRTCLHICATSTASGIAHGLSVLDVCVRYSCLPPESLDDVISTLCHTMNVQEFAATSWELMRHILGTHLGHRTVCLLCHYLQHESLMQEISLLRGAVFYLTMGLWGPHKRQSSIVHPPGAVLPALKKCLRSNSEVISVEVTWSLQELVRKEGQKLTFSTWDLLMDIMDDIFELAKVLKTPHVSSLLSTVALAMEELVKSHSFGGCRKGLFAIMEKCAAHLPESSVFHLMDYRASSITRHQTNWLTCLNQLIERFYKHESRTVIRVKSLEILSNVFSDNRQMYEEDLIDKIVLPLLKHIECETDLYVGKEALKFLVVLARDCTSKACTDIIQVIGKVMNKPFESSGRSDDFLNSLSEDDINFVECAATGLIEVFKFKMFRLPTIHTIHVFQLLVSHVQQTNGKLPFSRIRSKIFSCLLQLRCNYFYQIGLQDTDGKTTYSRYLVCATSDKMVRDSVSSPAAVSPTSFSTLVLPGPFELPMKDALLALVACLQREKDWTLLQMILEQLPNFLQNRVLVLSAENAVCNLSTALCSMICDRHMCLPDALCNAPNNFSRSDFHSHVLPVLASLVTYHKQLDGTSQRRLVKCLEFGLVSRCARICIVALMVCTLEMHDTMYKVMPGVLLSLSKISATVGISVPILEFLSSLIRLPRLYASFVEDQYMSIFAIALPYVNPFKFNHYTVSLAYHVIAMWFLKCRLPFRRDFVKFIIKGLQSNVLVPLDEGDLAAQSLPSHSQMEDSSQRRRAATLNEQVLANRRRDCAVMAPSGPSSGGETCFTIDPAMRELNIELTETCIDLMARYTFAGFTALPKRFSASEFLLSGGQSLTWLVGTKLVSVTTSGCSSKVLKHGLCDKCLALCRAIGGEKPVETLPLRRRHRSAILRSNTAEVNVSQPRTKDDLQLQCSSSIDSATASLTLKGQEATSDERLHELEAQNLDRLFLAGLQEGSSARNNQHPERCNCWCQGWAEILVRRPTGNVSWMMRVQNPPHQAAAAADFPLADITSLFLPTREKNSRGGYDASHRRINSETLEENEYEKIFQEHFEISESTAQATSPAIAPATVSGTLASTPEVKNVPARLVDKPSTASKGSTMISSVPRVLSKVFPKRTISVRETPTIRRVKSSPELSSGAATEHKDAISRTSRVYSDAAALAQKSRQQALTKLHKMERATALPPPEPLTIPQPETKPAVIPKPKVTLRRHSSNKEDQHGHDVPASVLLRRGSDRGVHFESKLLPRSPPLSPGLGQKPDFSSSTAFRDRMHTISVANPTRSSHADNASKQAAKELHRSGTNPSFVFLQLFHDSCFGNPTEKPMLLPKTEVYERAVKCFDRMPPYETHKIGVVYIGKGQANDEAAILGNCYGSDRYMEFLRGLGQLIRLEEVDSQNIYIGGLDRKGGDGKFAFVWQDDIMQVIFHVATLMPTKESDPNCVSKKLHIGNDHVTIVYNDSDQEYSIQTIRGQFTYACIVIQPLDHETNLVVIKTKPGVGNLIGHSVTKIISNENLPILARQLALHANLASMIFQSQTVKTRNPYASNWLERLRDLKRLRRKLTEEAEKAATGTDAVPERYVAPQPRCGNLQDFTEFV